MVSSIIKTNNQCNNFYNSQLYTYDSLNYRSQAEVEIAKAIHRHNHDNFSHYSSDDQKLTGQLIWMPNAIIVSSVASLDSEGIPQALSKNIESDFLIYAYSYSNGMVSGILEVDGSQHSKPDTALKDRCKENIWRQMGIKVIERFSAKECVSSPDGVLNRFLTRMYLVHDLVETYFSGKDANEEASSVFCYRNLKTFIKIVLANKDNFWEDFLYNVIPLSFDGYTFHLGVSFSYTTGSREFCERHLIRGAELAYGLSFNFKFQQINGYLCFLAKHDIDEILSSLLDR